MKPAQKKAEATEATMPVTVASIVATIAQGAALVIPSKSEDTLVRAVEANFENPYAIKRGRGRTHIPFVAVGAVYETRKFLSSLQSDFGNEAVNVNVKVRGFDQLVDSEGRALFMHPELGEVARSGSIKTPTFYYIDPGTGEQVQLKFPEGKEEQKEAFVAELEALPLDDEIRIIDGPHFKATWGTNYNVPESRRTAEPQLSMPPFQGFPKKPNTYTDSVTGLLKDGKDIPDWDQLTGIESRVAWALKNHKLLGNEDLTLIVESIPESSELKAARKASANMTGGVQQLASIAEADPFKSTV